MNNWLRKRVLVTGSSGVIGRVLVSKLIESGATVLSVDLVSNDLPVEHINVDLSKRMPLRIIDFKPNVVFHLAAAFERAIEEPGYWTTSFDNNALLSHKLLREVANVTSLETFVFASSYLIYDPELYLNQPQVKLLHESDPIRPRNLVGTAKYLTEQELDFVDKVENRFRTISARIFRVYGRGSRDVISRWVRAALAGEDITTYGLGGKFDYIFADDVAEGLLRLAVSDAQGVVNLGYGKTRSVRDVTWLLKESFILPHIRYTATDYVIEAACADMTHFEALTGWSPEISLEDGMDMIIAYEHGRMAVNA